MGFENRFMFKLISVLSGYVLQHDIWVLWSQRYLNNGGEKVFFACLL